MPSSAQFLPLSVPSVFHLANPASTALPKPAAPPPKKQKKNSVPVSKEAIDNELLKRELNTASARITSLDRELQSYKETCSILSERIKFFETQHTQQTYNRYFSAPSLPEATPPGASSSGPSLTTPPPAPSPCPPPPSTEPPTTAAQDRAAQCSPPPPSTRTSPAPSTEEPTAFISPEPQCSAPNDHAASSGPSPPKPRVPQPSGHCQCTLKLMAMQGQMDDLVAIVSQLQSSPPPEHQAPISDPPPSTPSNTPDHEEPPPSLPNPSPSHAPGTPEVPLSTDSNSHCDSSEKVKTSNREKPSRNKRTDRTQVHLQPQSNSYARPSVWMPGYSPPSQIAWLPGYAPHQQAGIWPPKPARNYRSKLTSGRPRNPSPPASEKEADLIDLN